MAISLSTVFSASATTSNPENGIKALRTELSSFIGKNIPIELNKATTAEVSFIVNNKNEVVVLSVDSRNSELNYFLKHKLNYKKITTKGVKKGKVYKIPLKVNIS
jgi:type 1 fimbria pilin